MVNVRCSATTSASGRVHRCQLLAGHTPPHASVWLNDRRRVIRTWTQAGASQALALPALLAQHSWAPGCPITECDDVSATETTTRTGFTDEAGPSLRVASG